MLEDIQLLAAQKALAQGDYALAWMNARQVLESFPRHAAALLTAGRAALATGNGEAAKHLLLEALLRAPENPEVQDTLLRAFLADQALDFTLPSDPLAGLYSLMTALPDLGHMPLALGLALEARGQQRDALGPLGAAARLMPAHGLPATRLGLIELDLALGPARPRPVGDLPASQRLSMSDLGERGRLGNQIIQYIFLLCHSERLGLARETPEWLGDRLFMLGADGAMGPALPRWRENEENGATFLEKGGPSLGGRDVSGYFSMPTRCYQPWKAQIRAAFAPATTLLPRLRHLKEAVASRGRTLVALHLRQTQTGKEVSRGEAPLDWYLDWLQAIWKELDAPVLYVASNQPDVVLPRFSDFKPMSGQDLAPPLPGAGFIDDFLALTQAEWLGLSPSSFSQSAALLAASLRQAVYPDAAAGRLAAIDPWDAPVFLA